jgi:hypothetical protein
MNNAQKIVSLYKYRKQLEEELSAVKDKLQRLALLCDDKGISSVKADGESLTVVSNYYAPYLGKGSAAEHLMELRLNKFLYVAHDSYSLGKHLRKSRHLRPGQEWEGFVLQRKAWFQR